MQKSQLTSNQYYGGLNRRFDNRAAKLLKVGYKYTISEIKGESASFIKVRSWPNGTSKISATVVLSADRRFFYGLLRNFKNS